MTLQIARRVVSQGDLARAETLLLEAVRMLKGLNDRARLCEAQRSLAELYVVLGRLHIAQDEVEQGEKLLREALRTFKGLRDRAHLCEAQRSLAQLLAAQGRLEEAERLALEARETVGNEDKMSISTTKLALGTVRAAQRRDEEAEQLMREAVDGLEAFQMYSPEREALRVLAGFLRDRGREDEAAVYEERLVELLARSAAPIA